MSKIAQLTGQIQVGESGLTPELSAQIAASSGAVTGFTQGVIVQSPSGPTAAAFPGLTNASFLWIRAKDNVTLAAKDITIRLNGTITLPVCSEFFWSAQTLPLTTVELTVPAGNAARIEYIIAGT